MLLLFSFTHVCEYDHFYIYIFCTGMKLELQILILISQYCPLIDSYCTERLADSGDGVPPSDSSSHKELSTTMTAVDDCLFGPTVPPVATSLGTVDHRTALVYQITM